MRRTLLAMLALGLLGATTQLTHEVRVGTSATPMLSVSPRSQVELQNSRFSATSIWCARGQNVDGGAPLYPDAGAQVALGRAHEIIPGASWVFPSSANFQAWCIAGAAQDGGAATTVDEAP